MATEYFILNLGQSNAEPTASVDDYLALVPRFDPYGMTPDPAVSAYYGLAVEEVRFLTFYNPEAGAAYPGGSPPAPFDTLGWESYCRFLPWTKLEGGLNPEIAGFRYPNAFCVPAGPLGGPAYLPGASSAIDLARRFTGWLKRRVNVITLAVGGSSLMMSETSATPSVQWGWYDSRKHNNWSPADSYGLCARLRTVLEAAKVAATAEGSTLRCLLVTMHQGETDSTDEASRALFAKNAPAFVKWVRDLLVELALVDCAGDSIPFVWPHMATEPWTTLSGAVVEPINGSLDDMAEDDPFFWTFSTDSFEQNPLLPGHYGAEGIMSMSEAEFAGFLAIREKTAGSFPEAGNVTLAQMREQVLRITERNTSDSGQTDDVVNDAIAESVQDLISSIGDTAWWLRLMTPFRLNSNPTLPVDLPRPVSRLLEIRPAAYPTYTYDYTMVGHSDRGRVRIATLDRVNDDVVLHHIYQPPRVMVDGERLLVPLEYLEAVKVGAAFRVATSTSNNPLRMDLQRRAVELKVQAMSHAQKVDRQRRQRLTGGLRRSRYYRQTSDSQWRDYPWQ